MSDLTREEVALDDAQDVLRARHSVRRAAVGEGFGLVDQTRLVTAASELARNTVLHGGGGRMSIERLQDGRRNGLRLCFEDEGPGITDVEQALQDGWTSGDGLGLGLGGARRLAHDFDITTAPGRGTAVTITRWA